MNRTIAPNAKARGRQGARQMERGIHAAESPGCQLASRNTKGFFPLPPLCGVNAALLSKPG